MPYDKIDQLYDALYADGAVSKDREYFREKMLAPGEQGYRNRKQLYDALKADGAVESPTYEDFAAGLGLHAGKPERVPTPSYQPTQEEMAGFQQTIRSAGGVAQNPTQSYERKSQLMKKRQGLNVPKRVNLGESNNLTPTDQGYMTGSGLEYENKAIADMEQRELDQQAQSERWQREHPEESIDGRIANLEQKRNEAYAAAVERARQATEPQSGIAKTIHDIFTPDREGIAVHDRAMDLARQDKDVMALDVALRDLKEAKTMLQRNRELHASSDFLGGVGIPFTKDWFNNWKNFGYGVWDALDDVTINFAGTNDLEKAQTYLRIKDKMERGEELTDQETDVALAGMTLAQIQQSTDLPHGYTAGQTTLEMAPFMLQMAANPGSGIGKAFARKAVRKFGRDGIAAITARVAARVAGNVGEAAILSNTWQAPKTIADIAQRHAGEFGYDEDGNMILGHYEKDENGNDVFVEGGKGLGQSIFEGEAASIIENFTELGAGGSINGMLSKAAGSKLGKKLGLGYISDLVGKVGTTPFARSMKKFMERTHWDGMIEEPLEEEYGIILNSLLTGDNKISDLLDSKQQADIFAGTMWFGGMMAAMNTAAYPFAKRAMRRNLNNADVQGEMAFRDEWPTMKATIDNMDDKDIADFLYGIKDDNNFTPEQKSAMFGYAARLKQYQGANTADMLMRMEGNLSNEESAIKSAYDNGTDIETPDEMKFAVDEAEAAGQNLTQYGPEFTAMVANGSVNPTATLNYMMNNRDIYSDEEIAAAADYYQKHARAQGVMDSAMDRIDLEVEKANAEVRGNMHQQSGQVITAQSGDGAYYIIGGDVVTDEETGLPVVAGTGGAVVVKDALTGEVSVKSPQDVRITSMQSTEDMIRYNEEVLRQQLEQQADEDITYGSPANEVFDMEDQVTLQDGEGGTIEGTIVMLPNAVDGVFVVETNDGKALQMTADELNRRIVAHNGMEVQRASQPVNVPENTETGNISQENGENSTQNAQNAENYAQNQPENIQTGTSGSSAVAEDAGQQNQKSALDRIPIRTDSNGQPVKGKNGRPVLDWHKASVEDAAAALIETTGGDMVMARDTASDLVKNEQARLEKVRKQKPKGDDPIEIAESRVAIRKQEQEVQAIIKQWQDVGQQIQKQMRDEQNRLAAEREAAKSEEQRQREAEEARIRQEKQDEQDRQRLREQIEKDKAKRNREYEPLLKAREELADDPDALAILNDTEPRDLEEWVSSLLRPHSMLWQDASNAEVGLQSELGLKRADMQRMMSLLGTKESGAKPFGKVVLDIYEGLSDAMKQQYTDEDVRRTLLNLFNEGSSTRMLNLTQEHRIEEARQTARENARRDAEAEMDAWAEAYHLTPEEREQFEDYLEMPPTEPEQEIINQIIAEYESYRTSPSMGGQPVSGGNAAQSETGKGQVQSESQTTGNGNNEETAAQGEEATGGEPAPADHDVAGRKYVDLRANLKYFVEQTGIADDSLIDNISDYEVDQLVMMIEDWEAEVKANGSADELFEPIHQYVEGLQTKYSQTETEGVIPTPEIDNPRYQAIRQGLINAYASGNTYAIAVAVKEVQKYVDEGLDSDGVYSEEVDDYEGNDPTMLADQYMIHVFQDRYLDDDEDQEYIKTGLKPIMRQTAPSEQPIGKTSTAEEIAAEEAKVDTNPTEGQKEAGNYQKGHINVDGYDITIENPKGSIRRGTDRNGKEWESEIHNTYGYIRGTEGVDGDHIDVYLSDNPTSGNVFVIDQVNPDTGEFDEHKVMYGFTSEEEARQSYLSNYKEGWKGLGNITEVSREEFKKWVESSHRKTKPFAEYKSVKKAAKTQQQTQQAKPGREHKRLVSDDKMAELRKRLLDKMNNLNEGLDMERMLIGAAYAVGKIERGVTKFADFCADMIEDLGDAIRPYLKLFYNGARDLPEAAELRPLMDDAQTVEAFDVYNFDKKKQPTAIEKAEQVVQERKVRQQAKKIKAEQPDLFAGDLFGGEAAVAQQQTQQKPAKPKLKTSWWSDPNRPQSIDPKDYKTYMTDEAKEYFANFVSEDGKTDFTKWAHPNLAYITAAIWDEVEIPYEDLKNVPEIVEAENTIKQAEAKGKLEISDEEANRLAQRLVDMSQARQERKALVIIGLPAGGKSSVFANPLSKEYGARIIDSDDVKPWLDGFDGGNGAGYVHDASAVVAERAIDISVKNGDNIIIPRIGGKSVMDLSAALRLAGYDVQLYFNDVKGVTSIDRAASRFAETGRYLSLDYLTKKAGVPSDNFSKFAEKSIGGYLDERDQKEVQNIRRRLQGLRGELYGSGSGLWESLAAKREGAGEIESTVQADLGGGEQQAGGNGVSVLLAEPLFNYAEWKSNDVKRGEKPKEIWNSESGKPMPGKEKKSNDNNDELHSVRSEQGLSAESSSVGEGAEQAGGPADRTGAERSPESDRAERSGRRRSVENTLGVPNEGEETRDSSGGPAQISGNNARVGARVFPKHNNRRNNVGERGHDYAPTSPKARFNANVEAIKLMRVLMDEGVDAPTKDQMEVLRKYSGWGGLGTFFNDATTAEYRTLRDLLTEEEYNDAVMSINSAYYTPATVIDTLWDIAEALGFEGENVLEGSAGIGNIIGQMPKKLSSRSDIEAVEIDKISGNILKLLYPDAKVHIAGFQDVKIPNGSVDLAITNVPFVTGLHVFDEVDKDLSRKFKNIHDFCIAKNIRKLREGGIGLFITSAGTLDKSTDLRSWITDEGQADVVGAFRLNNETFGGTNVTSDIIVVRKRVNGVKSDNAIDVKQASPIRVGSYEDKYGDEHQTTMTVNDYFHNHPEMMAGEMAFGYEKGDTFRPGSYGLYPVEGKSQEEMMKDFVKAMGKAKDVAVTQQQTEQKPEPNQLTAVKEGRMLIDDNGRLCVSRYGTAWPLGLNDQKVKGHTKQQCFKDYQDVQKAVDDVLQQQLNDPDDAKLEPKLKALNAAFDKFVKRYGTLHKNTAISFLRNDIDFPSFQALENYSETKDMNGKVIVKTSKTPLFSERVLGFKTEPQPKTVKDAVIASIFRSNGIDLDWIAEKLSEVAAPPNGDHWTADDVRKGILVSRLGFEDPATGQIEIRYKYLSGNVREKLAMAEAYNTDGQYAANVEELRKAVPMDIPAHLIDFSLGSSWISIELYKDYLKENFDLDNIKLSHVEGNWVLDEGYGYRNEKNRVAGVYSEQFRETIYGHQLVVAALNNRPYKVSKQVSEGWGSSKTTKTVVDKNATQACAVRVDEIKDEFRQWAKKKMQDDPELGARIEKIYNEKFNALVPMEIDDDFLPEHFEGSNKNITLRPHQKRGVIRDLASPTMLAHEVGTGKSFTLITTAMEMRRLGTARKPMLVVQNATVAQMTSDAKLLYPNAKVLSLTEKDRDAEGRRAFYAKIKYNDWDLIIIPQSTFERIPDSPERELQFIQEKIDEKKHVIEAAMQSGMDSREIQRLKKELDKLEMEYGDKYLDSDPANGLVYDPKYGGYKEKNDKKKKKDAKKEAAALDKAKTKAQEQLDRATDDVQFFDDLGVDALLIDEAHEYKHLGFQTSIGRGIKGIDPSYSKKCAGLYNKTRSVFEKAGWKNVVFATGTPISNTAAEIWTFMKYLMPADVMRANDIYYFDDFVHNFGAISQMLEFATSGKFKENTRFAAYVNKPELIRIWSQVADTVLTKDAKSVQDKLPKKEGGKDEDVFLPQSPSLIRIMAAVRAELERFENMTGQEKKENSSIPLTMYGIAKRAAIDPRLVDAGAPDEPMSKTNAAVKEIVNDLKSTEKYKGTVAVFCDNQNRKGADGSVEFNIYDDMKEKLVKAGVPADQIAIIKSGMSITAKQKVFDAVNAGTIRVVLGSTQTLGTGVNMQERLHLLIHMDAPDRPMDYTQRNGRIERQGNLHKEWGKTIRIVRFGVEDSLDVTAYQRLKTKSGFINSIMDGKAALANNQVDRTVEEEEEGLFDNPVAVLSGSQYALKKNQAERELRKYQGKKAQWEADQVYVSYQLRRNKSEVEATKANIKTEEEQLAHIRKLFPDGKVKTITVEGTAIDMTKDDGEKKLSEAIKEKINEPVNAIVKRNRENAIYNDETLYYTIKLDGHDVNFKVQVMRESVYDQGRMRTVIHKYISYASPDLRVESTAGSNSVRENVEEILDQVITGRDYEDRIDAYKAKINRINAETEQLQQRVGMQFQYDKELEQARKNVEEYTELMKKEMEEKEAKYAAQQQEAKENGGFDLNKAEDSEDEDDVRYSAEEDWEYEQPMFRGSDEFMEGQQFPIRRTVADSSYNVIGRNYQYSSDLLPDEFATPQALLDAVRNAYPEYYATIEAESVIMRTWDTVLAEARNVQNARKAKGTESYIERKTRQAINAVTDMANRMHLDVEVLTTTDGLTGKKARSKGWFNPKTHKIVIVLPNNVNKDDVINTLLHEGVAHYGLRKMFGRNFDTFLDNVYNNVSPEIKARIDAAIKRNGWSRHEATEEYLARLAEHTDFEHATTNGWWQKIKDFFLEMLSKAGFNTRLSDNELRYILWRSYDNLLHPDGRRNIFDTAKEIQMQSRLKVGDYREQIRIQRTGKVDTSQMVAADELLDRTDYASDEINDIVDKAKADGTYMKAPNGKPTNLNELQWAQVRTQAFKNWFGDWENDPENASKVIDENGEPKVMYHGTNLDAVNNGEPFWVFYENQHFGTKRQAMDRTGVLNNPGLIDKYNIMFYEVFLNIRNPQRRSDANQDYLDENDMSMSEFWQQSAERAKGKGYDGIVYLNEYEAYENPTDSWIAFEPNQIKSATDNSGDFSTEDNDIRYSIRTKEPPKKTGKGYKVFYLHNGQLYPPMVANPEGEGTPVGIWLDADAAPVVATGKTGRQKVKAGGKGTQGGSGQLAYRPGWHLGTIPYALQFNRGEKVDNPLGITNKKGEVIKVGKYFPNDFVWAEVEYADDENYQKEAESYGYNEAGNYQPSLAGLPRIPVDGSYEYRTNPNPATDPWIITGAMRVNKILSREEVDKLVREAGREPQEIQDGDILTQDVVDELNAEIKATKEADEMGLLYRDDDAWTDDVAQEMYEKAVAQEGIKVKEAWQDSMVALKLIQNAIAKETGKVATGAEDAYRFENRMHGRAKNMTEQYDWKYYRPMLKAFNDFCKANGLTQEQGMEYLISKSGLERNVYYAFRDGAKAKLIDDVKAERDQLERDYARGRISEADYRTKLADLNIKEQNGVDDFMKDVRETYAYQHAKEEYDAGNIGYTEYLRIIETIIRDNLKRKTPKKDEEGHVISDNYYDDYAKDYSGLTETFAKDMYDSAQTIKKEAQRTIDPQERRGLWAEYDEAMRQAYQTARQIAEDAVFAGEDGAAVPQQHTKLWDRINAATKETLKQSYDSGLMDRNTYNKVRAMFDYYIPLRGWEEDKASDVYTYMGRENVFSPAVKKAWGRTSKAENPLAYIGNIAVSTILSGHRNQMKQHFLNYVMNNPTSLVSISESWYENIAPEGEAPVWILRTADTAGKSPDEIAQIVNDFNDEMHQKQAEGKAMPVRGRLRLDVHATSGQKSEHVVEVQRAGHTYQLYINGNPKAAQALNNTAAKAVSRISDTWLGKKITKINRDMAMFFTSKNPAFVVSNLSRDLNMAGASVAVNEGKKYNAKFIENVVKVLAPRLGESSKWVPASKQPTGLMPSLMRKWKNGTLDISNETERYFKEFMDEGGETGFVNMLSIDSFKEKMKEEIAEMNGSALFGKGVKETSIHKGLRLLGETFEFYNRCAEDATRFIVYMTSRQMGKTLEESIADAKDVTLNFNRKGTGGLGNAEVRDLFIFVNPAIQALANMYRMAKAHPLKFGAVTAAFVAGGALMPIINQWLLNMFGDDDDKQAYWNLPPWVRKNNLVFWLPFTKNFLTIPLAQEFRVFYGVGEMMSSAIMDHPMDKWGLEVFSSVSDLIPINPTGNGGNLMVDFAPTMVQPLMQVGENVDFTGKPIWRENQGNKYAPMYEKAYVTTSQWMIKMSEKVNDFTGGNEGRKGVVEKYAPFWGDYINNPAVWNHLLQGYFGGMYNTIAKTFDVGVTAAKGELPKIYQTPVINRFLNRPVERDNAGALGEEYYNLTEERDAIQYELRTWQKKAADGEEGAQEHVDEILESPEYKRAEVVSHYEKIMKDLKAGEKAATESADKDDIKESIGMYKQQMMEELDALDEGKEPIDAAIEAFGKAKTFSEKNRLRMRIERLMMRQNGAAKPKTKGRAAEVEKALSYVSDIEKESRDTNEKYLLQASADDVRDDARIKAAKAKLKVINDEHRKLRGEQALQYFYKHEKELTAYRILDQQSRLMNQNKKLLGKGSDQNIMKLIANNRRAMLDAIGKID